MSDRESVVRTEPLGGDLPGTVHLPPERETAPGILLLHGSGGEPIDGTASALAEEGFVAAAIQYFGDHDGVQDDLSEVPLEGIDAARAALADHGAVAGAEVGLYGGSKGAELALLVAAHFEGIGAVVSVVGSCYAWEGMTQAWQPTGTSSWSLDGEPVPHVPFVYGEPSGDSIRAYYELAMERADEETLAEATIPVEHIDAPVLFVSGGADRMWPSSTFANRAMERLERHEHPYPSEHLCYEEAGHAIGPPGVRAVADADLETLGGTVEASQRAGERYWPEVCSLFRSHLGE